MVWQRVRKQFDEKAAPQIAMLAAFIFVAQMINIPISGGTSGHLVGGMLAALLLGPFAGILVLALVLTVQMLLFQDGGLTALGANIFNMAFAGIGIGYIFYRFLEKLRIRFFPSRLFRTLIIFLAAWLSIESAALFAAGEMGFSGLADMRLLLGLMGSVHALIGILEGIMTVLIFEAVSSIRSDLVFVLKNEKTPEAGSDAF